MKARELARCAIKMQQNPMGEENQINRILQNKFEDGFYHVGILIAIDTDPTDGEKGYATLWDDGDIQVFDETQYLKTCNDKFNKQSAVVTETEGTESEEEGNKEEAEGTNSTSAHMYSTSTVQEEEEADAKEEEEAMEEVCHGCVSWILFSDSFL